MVKLYASYKQISIYNFINNLKVITYKGKKYTAQLEF